MFSNLRGPPRGPLIRLSGQIGAPAVALIYAEHGTKKHTVPRSFSDYFYPRDCAIPAVFLRGGATPLLCTGTQMAPLRASVNIVGGHLEPNFAHRIVFNPVSPLIRAFWDPYLDNLHPFSAF